MNIASLTSGMRWIPVRNMTGEPIPPLSFAEAYEIDNDSFGRLVLRVRKPSRTDISSLIGVTDDFQIPPGGNGVITFDSVVILSMPEGEDIPVAGQSFGPIEDSWRPSLKGGGFTSCYWPSSRLREPTKRFVAKRGDNTARVYGVLSSNLTAATSITDPGSGTMTIYKPTDMLTSPIVVASTGITIELTNRDSSLEGDNAAFCKAEWIDGEWQPYWVGCP